MKTDRIGQKFGDYRLTRSLGGGGYCCRAEFVIFTSLISSRSIKYISTTTCLTSSPPINDRPSP